MPLALREADADILNGGIGSAPMHVPVAKLDIASDSDSEDRGFESRRARQSWTVIFSKVAVLFIFRKTVVGRAA